MRAGCWPRAACVRRSTTSNSSRTATADGRSPSLPHERRRGLFQPLAQLLLRLELGDLDPVDGRPSLSHLAQLLLVHLAHPQDAMPLEAAIREVDRALVHLRNQ